MQAWTALVAALLLAPQALFIPLPEAAIDRQTETRIEALRSASVQIVAGAGGDEKDRGLVASVDRVIDPWHDLVHCFHDLTDVGVKFVMISAAMDETPVGTG